MRRLAIALLATLPLAATATIGVQPTSWSPLPDDRFETVPPLAATPAAREAPRGAVVPPRPAAPPPRPPPVRRAAPRPPPRPVATGPVERGTATWYCRAGVSRCFVGHPDAAGDQLFAAILLSDIRRGHRGDLARVCLAGTSRCVVVLALDCLCASAPGTIVDLYADAFARLAPTTAGRIRVSLTWLDGRD